MKKNGFMEGAIIATLAIIVSKVLGLLYVVPFYNIIGEQGGALYGYAYNIYNIFLIISSAGIPLAISKITSEYTAKEEIRKKTIMFGIAKKFISLFSIISFSICFIFAGPIAKLVLGELSHGNTIADVTFVIRCVSFDLIVVPLLSILRGYLQGHKYITPSSLSQVIEQIVRIAVILLGSFLALKVFNLPLKYAVGISVLAAGIGAIFSYIYLIIKSHKYIPKEKIEDKPSKEEKRIITKRLIACCVPFIIVNITTSVYNTTDMILMNRALHFLNYPDIDVETISSVFTTWGSKLLSIVTALATGLVISLIPNMVSAYVKKEKDNVNNFFNKSLQVLLFIILPLTIFMSIYAPEIWMIFYGKSFYGPLIFRFIILVAFFDSANITINSSLQALSKNKILYFSEILGFSLNLILDFPLMLLFNKWGIYPFYGAIVATIIGYLVSHIIVLTYLHKKEGFLYTETLYKLPRLFFSIALLIVINLLLHNVININSTRILSILVVGICGIISFLIYYFINYKTVNEIIREKLKKKQTKTAE